MRIQLTDGTSRLNFICYLAASLLTISFFVFLNGAQSYVLSSILNVPDGELGDVNGSLVFYDELLSIILLGTWGVLSDRLGRQIVFVSGFLVMGAAITAYPFATRVYPDLLLFRLIFGTGAAACSSMITAVLADYVGERHKGKVSGAVGLCSGLGAVIGAFVFIALPDHFLGASNDVVLALKYSFVVVGCLSMVFGIVCMFGLTKPETLRRATRLLCGCLGKDEPEDQSWHEDGVSSSADRLLTPEGAVESCPYLSAQQSTSPKGSMDMNVPEDEERRVGCTMPGVLEQPTVANNKPFWTLVAEGMSLGFKSPSIFLALMGGFVARGDSIIITLFLPLWINKHYRRNDLCKTVPPPNGSPFPSKDPIKSCREAFRLAYGYSGVAQTFALIGAPIFGFLSDRFHRSKVFTLAASLSFLAYSSMFFILDPQNKIVWLLMVLVGFGEIGMIVTSLGLATSNVPADIRGAVAGTYSLFGGLGVLFLTKIGGILFDKWRETAPFLVVGLVSGLVALGGMFSIIKRRVSLSQTPPISPDIST